MQGRAVSAGPQPPHLLAVSCLSGRPELARVAVLLCGRVSLSAPRPVTCQSLCPPLQGAGGSWGPSADQTLCQVRVVPSRRAQTGWGPCPAPPVSVQIGPWVGSGPEGRMNDHGGPGS